MKFVSYLNPSCPSGGHIAILAGWWGVVKVTKANRGTKDSTCVGVSEVWSTGREGYDVGVTSG